MKVILLENVKRVGSIREVIEVKRGYARNFLIANKKALYASKENISEVEKIKTDLSKKDIERKKKQLKFQNKLTIKNFWFKNLVQKIMNCMVLLNQLKLQSLFKKKIKLMLSRQ